MKDHTGLKWQSFIESLKTIQNRKTKTYASKSAYNAALSYKNSSQTKLYSILIVYLILKINKLLCNQ